MDTNYWIVAVLFAAAAVLSVFGLGDASVLWNAYRSRFRQPESGRSESETEKDG